MTSPGQQVQEREQRIAEKFAHELYGQFLVNGPTGMVEEWPSENGIAKTILEAIREAALRSSSLEADEFDGVRFTFECGCTLTAWAQADKIKSGLSCCSLHEILGQRVENILRKCPLLLVRYGRLA